MITKIKVGVVKQKVYIAGLIHKELNTIQEALSELRWLQAIKEECNTLIKIVHEHWFQDKVINKLLETNECTDSIITLMAL